MERGSDIRLRDRRVNGRREPDRCAGVLSPAIVAEISHPWGHRQRLGQGRFTGDSVTRRLPLAALRRRQHPPGSIETACLIPCGYDQREPVEVRINPDGIDIVSFPGPDPSIRMESLRNRQFSASRYRNRRVGEFLKELKMTEGRSTGIPIIHDAMERNGSPAPRFETDEDRAYFLVELLVHPSFVRVKAPVKAPVEAPVMLSETDAKFCLPV